MHLSPTFQLYPSSPIGSRRLRAFGGALRFMGPWRKNQRVGECPLSGVKRTCCGPETKIKLAVMRLSIGAG